MVCNTATLMLCESAEDSVHTRYVQLLQATLSRASATMLAMVVHLSTQVQKLDVVQEAAAGAAEAQAKSATLSHRGCYPELKLLMPKGHRPVLPACQASAGKAGSLVGHLQDRWPLGLSVTASR
jgi:hypothetical protein